MAEEQYKRLTRARARTTFGVVSTVRSRLWLGSDHVLCIDTTGYTESYKRFYFRDIQALTIRKTSTWLVSALVLGGLGALFLLFLLMAINAREAGLALCMGIVAGLFLLAMAWDLAAGPSCKCYLRTAVQTEELPALDRVRRARKVLDKLRPLIVAAQGQLSPEEIPARLRDWMNGGTTATPMGAPEGTPPAAPLRSVVDDPNAPPRISS